MLLIGNQILTRQQETPEEVPVEEPPTGEEDMDIDGDDDEEEPVESESKWSSVNNTTTNVPAAEAEEKPYLFTTAEG